MQMKPRDPGREATAQLHFRLRLGIWWIATEAVEIAVACREAINVIIICSEVLLCLWAETEDEDKDARADQCQSEIIQPVFLKFRYEWKYRIRNFRCPQTDQSTDIKTYLSPEIRQI